MDSKSIRFFLVIAEEENMSKAAERLHMSQPPLSRQLKLLEEEVGTELFERGHGRLRKETQSDIPCDKWKYRYHYGPGGKGNL